MVGIIDPGTLSADSSVTAVNDTAVAQSLNGALTDNQENLINMIYGVGRAVSGTVNRLHPTVKVKTDIAGSLATIPVWIPLIGFGILLMSFLRSSGGSRR